MKTKRSLILILVMLMLLPMALAGCKGFLPLSAKRKAEIKEAYKIQFCDGDEETYQEQPLVWFDENGGEKVPGVVRYFGTYGDCIVLLRYEEETYADGRPRNKMLSGSGLTRRIYTPMVYSLLVYNKNPNCSYDPGVPNLSPPQKPLVAPITTMDELHSQRRPWFTDAEIEQLSVDLLEWFAQGNS